MMEVRRLKVQIPLGLKHAHRAFILIPMAMPLGSSKGKMKKRCLQEMRVGMGVTMMTMTMPMPMMGRMEDPMSMSTFWMA